mmetsp:Transcript_85185/g.198059  ORF Transcript_85185/g.198059 Transcript_85185/m.198059 type:complete len:210 (-) Transcript_85185:288-917(-)
MLSHSPLRSSRERLRSLAEPPMLQRGLGDPLPVTLSMVEPRLKLTLAARRCAGRSCVGGGEPTVAALRRVPTTSPGDWRALSTAGSTAGPPPTAGTTWGLFRSSSCGRGCHLPAAGNLCGEACLCTVGKVQLGVASVGAVQLGVASSTVSPVGGRASSTGKPSSSSVSFSGDDGSGSSAKLTLGFGKTADSGGACSRGRFCSPSLRAEM